MKILVADDEEVIRTMLGEILRRSGNFEVEFAADGEEAVNKVKTGKFSLLLLDLNMPKLTGYEVLKLTRKDFPDIPVIFITGTGEVKKIGQSIAQDKLNAFIEKPFTPEKVLNMVNKAVNPWSLK